MKNCVALLILLLTVTVMVPGASSAMSEPAPVVADLEGSFAPIQRPLWSEEKAGDDPATSDKQTNVVILQPHDGSFETGFTINADLDVSFAQLLRFPATDGAIVAFEACFNSAGRDVPGFTFVLRIFSAEGNRPGTQLFEGGSPAFTVRPGVPSCRSYEIPSGPMVRDREAFFAVEWNEADQPNVFVAVDTNSPSAGAGYGRVAGGEWSNLLTIPAFDNFRNLGIRAAWEGETETMPPIEPPDPGPGPCLPDTETLCLHDGRFEVKAAYGTTSGDTGAARVVAGASSDSANLYFFDENNWEVMVKVLDACAVNGRYWVFVGGVTDLGVAMRVRDTQTADARVYLNPIGQRFLAINDTDAFATCP